MEPVTFGLLAAAGIVGYEVWKKSSAANGGAPLSNVTPNVLPSQLPPGTPAVAPMNPTTGLPTDANDLAVLMVQSLTAHGYKACDQTLYRAFQTSVGLTSDGFPGTSTMTALDANIAAQSGQPAGNLIGPSGTVLSIPVYTWASTGAYDGVNAPLASDWNGSCS